MTIVQQIDEMMNRYIDRLNTFDLVEIARGLIGLDLKMPAVLEKELMERGQIKSIVEAYLSSIHETFDLEAVVDLIRRYSPDAINTLAESSLNLLVLLM